MFCHNCGKEIQGGVNFCPHCGKTLIEFEPSPKKDALKEDGEKYITAERVREYAKKAKETAQQTPDTVISSANSVGEIVNDDNRNSSFLKKNNGRNAKILFILILCILSSAIAFKLREPSLEERQKAYLEWFGAFSPETDMIENYYKEAQKTWSDIGNKQISPIAAKNRFIDLRDKIRHHAKNIEALGIPSKLSSDEKKALKESLKYYMDAIEKHNRIFEIIIDICSSGSKNKDKSNALVNELTQLKQDASNLIKLGLSGVVLVGHKLGLDSQDFAAVTEAPPSGDELQSSGKNTPDFIDTPNQEHEQSKQPKEQERTNSGNTTQATSSNENEVYVGTYDSGLKAYVLADTLIMNNFRNFSVTVKAVENNDNIIYVSYRFSGSPGNPDTWKNSQGYSGTLDHNKPSVEKNIYTYFSNRWDEHITKKGRS